MHKSEGIMHTFKRLMRNCKGLKEKTVKEIILNRKSSSFSIAHQSKDLSLTSSNDRKYQSGKTYTIRIKRLVLEVERWTHKIK